ncbi:MAG: MBL fold metallo-hydrolase [Actinobacteria bacterium]|nr:MBL fold metallo-hydrolase [Actinomycetota bacterium]
MKVHYLTVGPVAENTYLAINEEAGQALLIDPGDEPDAIQRAIDDSGAEVKAILITHTHFDHVGAVAEMARRTGAEVWVPKLEHHVLLDITSYTRFPGLGPFEGYDAEHDVEGGEKLDLAGFEVEVFFTPGHSSGHVSYAIREHNALFSGDVLFQGSIGRTDLPGGDMQTLLNSISTLMRELPSETTVFAGHMDPTTLAAEMANNPFLAPIR